MNRNSKNIMIAIMLGCILTMAVGYSILQQRLNIEGTANVSSVWDIQVTGIREVKVGGIAKTANLDFTPTSATFSTNIQAPGDYAYYEIEVENKGTLTGYTTLGYDQTKLGATLEDLITIGMVSVSKEPLEYNDFGYSSEYTLLTNTQLSTTLTPGEKAYYYVGIDFYEGETKLPTQKELTWTLNFTYEQAINFPMSKTLDVTLLGTLPEGITIEPIGTLTNSSDYTSQQLTVKLKRDTSVNNKAYSGTSAKLTYQLTNGNETSSYDIQSWISTWQSEELEIFTNPSKTEQIINFNLNISPDLDEVKKLYIRYTYLQ